MGWFNKPVSNLMPLRQQGPTEETSQTGIPTKPWTKVVSDLMPLKLNRFEIFDGEVHYRDFYSTRSKRPAPHRTKSRAPEANARHSPKPFSSLLIGVYNGKQLDYIGKVGTGFNEKLQKDMMQKFRPLLIKKSPFSTVPNVNEPSRFRPNPPHAEMYWLKPDLVCEVSFAEFTSDGVLRHPTVSMPLYWEEVKKGLKMKQFTLKNAMARIKSEGDIFNPVLQRTSVPKTLDL